METKFKIGDLVLCNDLQVENELGYIIEVFPSGHYIPRFPYEVKFKIGSSTFSEEELTRLYYNGR